MTPQLQTLDCKDNVRLGFRFWGDPVDPTVLFLHGLGANQRQFEADAAYFAQDGIYSALTVDLRGHGASKAPDPLRRETVTIEAMAEDIRQLIAALSLKRVHLVGNSMGGLVALVLLDLLPLYVRSLTTFGTTYSLSFPLGVPTLQNLIYRMIGPKKLPDFIADKATKHDQARPIIREMFEQFSPRLTYLTAQNIRKYDYRRQAFDFDGPILMLRGEDDRDINNNLKPTLKRLRKKKNFHLVEIADAGHFMNLDQPDAIRQEIEKFLPR
ncbi:MAG: alpha/beta hydrolase [Pseudomonadota bacterium]